MADRPFGVTFGGRNAGTPSFDDRCGTDTWTWSAGLTRLNQVMSYVVRAAALDDLPGIADVALATDQPAEGTAADVRYATHLLTRGRLVVASRDAGVVGYAGVVDVGDVQMLTDLFVLPLAHGQGIGGRLLDAVWSDARRARDVQFQAPACPSAVRASGHASAVAVGVRVWRSDFVACAESTSSDRGCGV